ncbi:hypothetical protein [Vampirovibrio sp.]|uniref:hypothetical protein n=1 Tax=Vampirovibrio sp. TaxID=2717857 RepID=UPI0035941170
MKQPHPFLSLTLAIGAMTLASSAFAYAPENDLMKIKGYSPEVIQTANQQRNRQEWKEASVQTKTTTEKFFHNIYYGNWMGPIDDFGSEVIRQN